MEDLTDYIFENHNLPEVVKALSVSSGVSPVEHSDLPQLVFTGYALMAGYYTFSLDGYLFSDCWIEPTEIAGDNGKTKHRTGSYAIHDITIY